MGYEIAINKAWEGLIALKPAKNLAVRFLADEYSVDLENRRVLSLSCNAKALDYTVILILHYLAKKLTGLPQNSGEWLDFKELSVIEGYQAAFKKRVIDRIIRKYGTHPEGVLSVLERLPGKRVQEADVGIVLEAFERVPALIQFWRADEEFAPQVNILFDKSIAQIFCIEDIVVLAEFIAASL